MTARPEAAANLASRKGASWMRMVELWKQAYTEGPPARLEDTWGPVLFDRQADAEEYCRREPGFGDASYSICGSWCSAQYDDFFTGPEAPCAPWPLPGAVPSRSPASRGAPSTELRRAP